MKLLTANANTANITTDYWQVIAADSAAGALNDLTKFSVGTITDDSGGVHYANAEDITKFFLGDSVSVGQTIGGNTEGFGTLSLPSDLGQVYGDNFIYVEDTTHFESGDSLVVLEGLKPGLPPYSADATSPDGFVSEFSTVGVVGLVPTMSADLYEGLQPAAGSGGVDSALMLPSNSYTHTPPAIAATILQKNSVFVGNANSNYYAPMNVAPTPNNVGSPNGSDPMYVACSGDPQALINMVEIFPDFVAFAFTGTLTASSNVITTVSDFESLEVGQLLTGLGIPLGTHISALDSTAATITMTNIATVQADTFLNPLTASGGQITEIEVGDSYTQITLANSANAALLGFSPGKTMTCVFYIASPNSYAPVGWYGGIITAVTGNVITTDLIDTDTFLYRIPGDSYTFPFSDSFDVSGATGELTDGTFQQQGSPGGNVFQPSAFTQGIPLGGMVFGDGDSNAPSVTFTGDTTEGSNTVANITPTVTTLAGEVAIFQVVTGAGIPIGTWITSYDATGNTLTLNNAVTATASGVSITAVTSVFYNDGTYTYLTNSMTNDETTTFQIDYVVLTATAFANQLNPDSIEVNTSGGNIFVASPYCAPYLYSDGVNNPSNGAFLVVPLKINAYDGSVASVTSINSNEFTGNYVTDLGYYGTNPSIINALNYSSLVGEVNPPIADANDPAVFGPIANVAVQAQGGITALANSSGDMDFLALDQVYPGIQVGMPVTGAGIPPGTVVTSVSGNTIGISASTALDNVEVTFGDTSILLPSVQGGAAELAAQAASIVPGMMVTDTQGYVQPNTQVGNPPFVNPPLQFTGTYTATAANFHTETVTENYYLNADGSFATIVGTGGFTNASSVNGGTTYTFTGSVADSSNVITVTSNISTFVVSPTQAGTIGWTITSDSVVLTSALDGGSTFVGAVVYTDPTDGTITMVDSAGTPIPWSTANGGPTSGTFLLTNPIHLMGIIPDAGYFKVLTPIMGSRTGSPTPILTTSEVVPTVGASGLVLAPQDTTVSPVNLTASYQAGVAQLVTATQPNGLSVSDIVTGPAGIIQAGTQINAITPNGLGFIIDLTEALLGPINLFRIKFAANAINSISTTSVPNPVPAVGEIVSDVNLNNCITNVFPSGTASGQSSNIADNNGAGFIIGPPGGGIIIESITPTIVGGNITHYGLICSTEVPNEQFLTSGAVTDNNYYGYTYSNSVLSNSFTVTPIGSVVTIPGVANEPGDTTVTITSSGLNSTQISNYLAVAAGITDNVDAIVYPAYNDNLNTGSWFSTAEQVLFGGGSPVSGGYKVPIDGSLTNYFMPGTLFPGQTIFTVGNTTQFTPGTQFTIGSDIFFVQQVIGNTVICAQTVNILSAGVTAGTTSLTVNGVANIVAGSNVVLGYAGASEVLNVLSISGTTLTFTTPVAGNYPTATGPNNTTYNPVLYGGFATTDYPVGSTVTVGDGIPGDTLIALSGNVTSFNHIFYAGLTVTITPEGVVPTPPTGQNAGSETVVIKGVQSDCNITGDTTNGSNKITNCTVTQGSGYGQRITTGGFFPAGTTITHVDPVGTEGGSTGPTVTVSANATTTETGAVLHCVDESTSDHILVLETGCLHYHARNEQVLLPLVYDGPEELIGFSWQDDGDAWGVAGAAFIAVLPGTAGQPTQSIDGVVDPTYGGVQWIPPDTVTIINKDPGATIFDNVAGSGGRYAEVGTWFYLSNGQYLHGVMVPQSVYGSTPFVGDPGEGSYKLAVGRTAIECQIWDQKEAGPVLQADGYNATKIVTGGGTVAGASITDVVLTATSPDLTIADLVAGYIITGSGTDAGKTLSLPTTPAVFVTSTTPDPLTSGGELTLTSSGPMPIGTFTAVFTAVSPEFGINITQPVVLPAGDQGNWPTLATFTTYALSINTTTNVIALSNTVLNGETTPRSLLADTTATSALATVTDLPLATLESGALVLGAAIAGYGVAVGTKLLADISGNVTLSQPSTLTYTPGVLSLGAPEAFVSQNAPTLIVDDSTEMFSLVTEGTTTFVYQNLIFSVGLGSFDGDTLTITTITTAIPPQPLSGDYAPGFPRAGVFVWENTITDDSAIENWTTAARVPPVAGVITSPKPFSYSHSPGTLVASYASGGRYFGSTTVGDLEFVIPTQVGSLYGSTLDVGVTANSSGALVVSPLPITIHNTGVSVDGSPMTYQSIANLDLMAAGGIVIVGLGTSQEAVLLSGSSSRVDSKSSSVTNQYPDVPVTWTLAAGQAFAYNHEPGEPVFLPNITADIFTAVQTFGPNGISSTYMTLNVIAGGNTLPVASTDNMYIGANLYILDGVNSEFVQVSTAFTGTDTVPIVAPFVNSHTGVPYPALMFSDAGYIHAGPYLITGTTDGSTAVITGVADTTGLEADMPICIMVGTDFDGYSDFTYTIASTTSDTITVTANITEGAGTYQMIAGTPDNWAVGQTIVGPGFEGVLAETILSITENQVFIGGITTSIGDGTGLLSTTVTAVPSVITNYNAVVIPTNITDLTTFPIGDTVTPIGANSIPLGATIDAVALQPHEIIINISAPATTQNPTFAVGDGFTLTHAQGSPILGSAEVEDNTPSLVASNTSGTDAVNATALVGMTTPWYSAGTDGAPSVDSTFAAAAPIGARSITLSGDTGFGESYPAVYQYNSLALPEIGRVIGEIQNGRISISYVPSGDIPLTFPVFIKLADDEYEVTSLAFDSAGNQTLVLTTPTTQMYPDMTSIHTTSFDTSSTYTQIDVPHFYLSGVNFLCLAASGVSVIGVSRLAGLAVGMTVTGIGVPAGTFIGGIVTGSSSVFIVDINGNPVQTVSPINNTPLTFGGADIVAGESIGQADGIYDSTTNGNLFSSPISFMIPSGSTIMLSYAGYTQPVITSAQANPGDTNVEIIAVKSNYAFAAAVGANGVFSTQGTSCYVMLASQLSKGDILFLSENGYSQSVTVAENTAVGTEYIAVEEFIPNYPYDDNVTPVSFTATVNPDTNIVTFASLNDYYEWAIALGSDGEGLAITTGGGAFETAPTIQELIKTSQIAIPLSVGITAGDTSTVASPIANTNIAVFEVAAGSDIVNWISGDISVFATGLTISGWGIPNGTTISSVNSVPIGLTLSTSAVADGAGLSGSEILWVSTNTTELPFTVCPGLEPVSVVAQVSCVAANNTIVVPNPAGITVGMALWGDGIYSNTTVLAINANTVTMSQAAYATTSGSFAYFSVFPYGTVVESVSGLTMNWSQPALINKDTSALQMTGVTGLRLTQNSVVTIPTTTVFSLGGIMFSAPQGLTAGTGSTQETLFTTGQPFINDDGSATVSLLEPTQFEHSAGEAITYNDFPTNPNVGDVMYNSVKDIYQMFDGNTWRTSRVNYVQPHYAVKVDGT